MHLYKGLNYPPWKPLHLSQVRKARFKDQFCRRSQATRHLSFPICKDVSVLILFTHAFMVCQELILSSKPGSGAPSRVTVGSRGSHREVAARLEEPYWDTLSTLHVGCSPLLRPGDPGCPHSWVLSQSLSWRKMHVDILFASLRRC